MVLGLVLVSFMVLRYPVYFYRYNGSVDPVSNTHTEGVNDERKEPEINVLLSKPEDMQKAGPDDMHKQEAGNVPNSGSGLDLLEKSSSAAHSFDFN